MSVGSSVSTILKFFDIAVGEIFGRYPDYPVMVTLQNEKTPSFGHL